MKASTHILLASLVAAGLGLSACATTEEIQQTARLNDRLGKLEDAVSQLQQSSQMLNKQVGSIQTELARTRHQGLLAKQIVLTEDKLLFPHNSVDLTGQDVKALDALIDEIKAGAPNYHVEIQGHTDDSGNPEFNYLLGEGRAKAVQRYLHQFGDIPLYRMSPLSYGARIPATARPGDVGTASSRRVEVLIFR